MTRHEIVEKIKQYELEGRFFEDVEDDPEAKVINPDDVDYLYSSFIHRMRAEISLVVARVFMNNLIRKRQLIIKDVIGVEHYKNLDSGAVITCNHFNALDSFAMHIAYDRSKHKKRKLFRVIKEGNYTSFPGFYGYLMRNTYTLPLSSNRDTMKKFMKSVNILLKKGHFVLIYPEQSMWWNYRKPKPLKKGAFSFAAKANVPVLPMFITMQDSDIDDGEGFKVQEYTIHIGKPIYPDANKSQLENVQEMLDKNYAWWKSVYEETYGIPLTYTCDNK
ncbi:MAG: lysophospholipid acyltransferase family protein [Lachnospiraceae bacterium]